MAVDDAKALVETVRNAVIDAGVSADPNFKLLLMKGLLETSIAEYGEAVTDGIITEMAEFQDGSAFVWRSQQIFNEIKSDIDQHEAEEIEGLYGELWAAYDETASPDTVETLAGGIIHEIDEITGVSKKADLEFAGALEETLGHFWAIERNLDERNAQLAVVHATHPIAELYDSMKPVIQDANPALDTQFQTVLLQLKDKATVSVSRDQAQVAVDDAKALVETVRNAVIDAGVSADPNFKLLLMKGLLETSIAEYGEAVTDGIITEVAEFQDGSAFVWRSQQIFNEIKSDIDQHEAEEIEGLYGELWAAYDETASPDTVETLAGGIIHEIDEITGAGDEGDALLDYVETIKTLLTDAKSEYRQGNADLALSFVTKAYLDNYEFVEGPLVEAGERELMEEVEILMREELRDRIRSGAPVAEIDSRISTILDKMDTVAGVLFDTTIPLGDSWNLVKSELSASEKASTTDEALSKLASAKSVYEDVFQAAAKANDAQDDTLIIATFSEDERLLKQGDIDQVKLNRQIIDKTIYKIAYHEIENAIVANDADGLLAWFDVMEKKFGISEKDYATNDVLATVSSTGIVTPDQGDTIKSDLLEIFKLKTVEEIEAAIKASQDGDAQGAKKFAYEGLYYYRTMHPDVERTVGPDKAGSVLRQMEEVIRTAESSSSTDAKIQKLETSLSIVETVIRQYEGGDTSPIGIALSGLKDRLTLIDIEYVDAVADGQIVNQVEYDETVAFLTRAQSLYGSNSDAFSALAASDTSKLGSILDEIDSIVTSYGDTARVTTLVSEGLDIVKALQDLSGETVEENLLDYVAEIRRLLEDARIEYRQGNTDLALSFAREAYLDNYEFLEGPLDDAGERDLMLEVETLMREELRNRMSAGAPAAEIDKRIDTLMERMDTVAVIVPEFGALVMVVLGIAVTSVVVLGLRYNTRLRYAA